MKSFVINFSSKHSVITTGLVCLVCILISVSVSHDHARSWVVALFTSVLFILCGELILWQDPPAPAAVLDFLFLATVPLLVFHVAMTLGRADGRIWSPTALANLMAALLMPALAMRRLGLAVYALGVVLLVGSRGGWLNVAAGLLTLAALEHSFIAYLKKLWPLGFIALPIMALQVLRPFERVSMWETGWAMFTAAPVWGMGPGTFGLFHPLYPDAHNLILNIAAETGAVGLVAFALLALAVGSALYARRASPFARGVGASLVGMLAAGLIGVPTYEIAVSTALAVLIGVALHD